MQKQEYERLQAEISNHLTGKKSRNKTNQIPCCEWLNKKEMDAYEAAIMAVKSIISNHKPMGDS